MKNVTIAVFMTLAAADAFLAASLAANGHHTSGILVAACAALIQCAAIATLWLVD